MSTTDENNNALVILTEFERKLAACTTLGEAKILRDEFHRYDIVDEKDLNASVAKLAAALAAAPLTST